MRVEAQGTVVKKFDTFTKGDFKKIEFVVNCKNGEYDNPVKLTATTKLAPAVEAGLNVGDEVKFTAFVQGNEWKDKFFINLNLASFEKVNVATPTPDTVGDLPF
jgi:hypothetical protein